MKEIVVLIIFVLVGLAQIIAGIQGIHLHFGGLGVFLVFLSLFFGFSLPITIGSFFGAMEVWGLPWFFALLLAAPGLLFIVPGTVVNFYKSFKNSSITTTSTESKKSNILGILISIFFITIFIITLIEGQSSTPNQHNYAQSNKDNYSSQPNYNLPTPSSTNIVSLDEIAKEQQKNMDKKNQQQNKKMSFQKQIIDGVIYNIIDNKYGVFYMTSPYLDSTGYLIKVRFPNMNNYGIVAMTPTNCKVYNKRMKGESSLNPKLYLNGNLQSIFESNNEADLIVVANYICNYEDMFE